MKNNVPNSAMNYRTIRKSTTSELVMNEILSSITSGEIKPGDQLPTERELTKMFGVSRSTVREATSALVRMDCLEVIQGKGTFLKQDFQPARPFRMRLSDIQAAANIFDLLEIREILECSGVRLAAKRADAAHIRKIKDALSKMKKAVKDVQAFTEHDFDFHISLAASTGNEMIHGMMKRVVSEVHQEYEKFKPKPLFQLDKAVATAERIVSSVVKGDEEEAAQAMHDHLNLVATELKNLMPDIRWPRSQR